MDIFNWKDISVSVPDRLDRQKSKLLLENANGHISPGEIFAIMGPSGCGKTTLLNTLAQRRDASWTVKGNVFYNGNPMTDELTRKLTSYVEQEDSLIGSLTVRETIDYSAQLFGLTQTMRRDRVTELLSFFGLEQQADTIVGTVIKKGISGGQKRRVSVASQLITEPNVLFLDEPTSGLDSTASYQIVSQLKKIAKAEGMMIIASIHQPSTSTFNLFDKVVFLSQGKTIYNGPTNKIIPYFDTANYPIPKSYNPAEYILDLINVDFTSDTGPMGSLVKNWKSRTTTNDGETFSMSDDETIVAETKEIHINSDQKPNEFWQSWILLKRLFIKSRRDILSYYVRLAMYLGLAILMGTVWLRLGNNQEYIQPFINAIFFSGAFMSFMAVAYIPSYLEDYQAFHKDRQNGLYGPTAFMVSNFLIGIPFLFLITLVFSLFTYFMVKFRMSATGFFRYVMWLFLDLVAAESLVVLVSSFVPIFVVALALVAFANGLFMAVGGFLVSSNILNSFWFYTFYWIDYQRYVFQGMMFNEFESRVFDCDSSCHCMYDSPLASQCRIQGGSILDSMGYGSNQTGQWVGLLIVLIAVQRLFAWAWLVIVPKLKR